MYLEEKTLQKNYVYNGKIINVRCDDAVLPDGNNCKREVVEHPGGSAVLFVKDNKVLMVKQYRYVYGEAIYEIPAGKLSLGEDPSVAAIRELEEETGYKAENIQKLFTIYPTPGYTNEKLHIYYVESAKKTNMHLDDDEFLSAEWIDIEKVKEMIEKGGICDAKTVIAIQWYLLKKGLK